MKTLITSILLIAQMGLFSSAFAADGTQINTSRQANSLVFYLASDDIVMGRARLEDTMARSDVAVSKLYRRLHDQNLERLRERENLKKEAFDPPEVFVFKSWEIREAAIEELVALGSDAIPVLAKAIRSARQDLTLGVLKVLERMEAPNTLPLLGDILERNKWGQTPYTTRVRRKAIDSLSAFGPEKELWKNLLETNLTDQDPEVRAMSLDVIGGAMDRDAPWVREQMRRSFDYEWTHWEKNQRKADSRGRSEQFESNLKYKNSLLQTLESMLKFAPSTLPQEMPAPLLSASPVVRLLLKYHHLLTPELRESVINVSFESGDEALILEALKALGAEDRKSFQHSVVKSLSVKSSPAILLEAIGLCEKWKLSEGKEALVEIAEHARHRVLKVKASEVLSQLP